ncbi:MAG: hypothetical protein KDE20_19750 [Caldilineaceae bacterium]|nr:hypothetical protein [Caldilineaceae bacterium]
MTSDTALATLNGATELSDTQAAVMAETQADIEATAFEFQPPKVRMPSGGVKAFTTDDGDVIQPGWTGIIAVSQMARAYWPTKDATGLPPLCSSPDSLNGWLGDELEKDQVKAALGAEVRHPLLSALDGTRGPQSCSHCPLSAWGSGEGRGQACKALRRLLVIPAGWHMPAILTLPPTSVKIFDQYASARQRTPGQSYFTVLTRFDLDTRRNGAGTEYAVIKLSVAGILDDAQIAAVLALRTQYAELVRALEITAAEYDLGV